MCVSKASDIMWPGSATPSQVVDLNLHPTEAASTDRLSSGKQRLEPEHHFGQVLCQISTPWNPVVPSCKPEVIPTNLKQHHTVRVLKQHCPQCALSFGNSLIWSRCWPWTLYVAKDSLELLFLLPPIQMCSDDRYTPPHPAHAVLKHKPRTLWCRSSTLPMESQH